MRRRGLARQEPQGFGYGLRRAKHTPAVLLQQELQIHRDQELDLRDYVASTLGSAPIAEIGTDGVQGLIDKIGAMRPANASARTKRTDGASAKTARARLPKGGRRTANKVAALLSALFAFAVKRRLTLANPAKGVERFEEHARERFLKPAELPAFLAAVQAEGEPWGDYLCFACSAVPAGRLSRAWAGPTSTSMAPFGISPRPVRRTGGRSASPWCARPSSYWPARRAEAVNAYVFPSATSGSGHVVDRISRGFACSSGPV